MTSKLSKRDAARAVLASALISACGAAPPPSRVDGLSRDDATTSRLRAVFANGDAPSLARGAAALTANDWTCSYHATTTAYGLVGHEDVTYRAQFQNGDTAVAEAASADGITPWTGSYRYSQPGLRHDGAGGSARLLRLIDDHTISVEWLYQAATQTGDQADPAIGDPVLWTAGIAQCTPAA